MQDNGVLTKAHYDFAQKVWNLMEEMKPELQRAHKAMYGYYFEEVTAKPFTNRFGEYRGGYIPAKIDPTKTRDIGAKVDAEEFLNNQNTYAFPSTGKGSTISRNPNYNRPLILDMRSIPVHIDWAMRFTYIQPAVTDVTGSSRARSSTMRWMALTTPP